MHPAAATSAIPRRPHDQAYMPPPEFANHCAACHTLQFDKRFGNDRVLTISPKLYAFLMKDSANTSQLILRLFLRC
jgi:hypothetical protein